jgi:hypothetical protein
MGRPGHSRFLPWALLEGVAPLLGGSAGIGIARLRRHEAIGSSVAQCAKGDVGSIRDESLRDFIASQPEVAYS